MQPFDANVPHAGVSALAILASESACVPCESYMAAPGIAFNRVQQQVRRRKVGTHDTVKELFSIFSPVALTEGGKARFPSSADGQGVQINTEY